MTPTLYHWREIGRIPETPGVYAWYYSPEITEFDLHKVIDFVKKQIAAGNPTRAAEAVRELLDKFVFASFREDPYQITLRGPLKPRYNGSVDHVPTISNDLIARILELPDRLRTIKHVLGVSAPLFASPIYIGMSDNLRARIERHKSLIEHYSCTSPLKSSVQFDPPKVLGDEQKDHSFAKAIHIRDIPSTRLVVAIHAMDTAQDQYVDIENILNRIHYPLLGRN